MGEFPHAALDRWLTTPPDDPFENMCEAVIEHIDEDIYEANEDFFYEEEFDKAVQELLDDGYIDPRAIAIEISKRFK